MDEKKLLDLLKINSENENLEFKEARDQFSILGNGGRQRKSLLGYVVAVGNEGGGYLILGVKNKINPKSGFRDIVGTKAIENIEDTKSQIFRKINLRIQIEEFYLNTKRVIVVIIPNHLIGQPLKFHGQYLMRVGEELQDMDSSTLRNILNEKLDDFSAEFCSETTLNDLDLNAINVLKNKWAEKTKNNSYLNFPNESLLEKLSLLKNKRITNAAIILLGNDEIINRYFPNSEFIFEWRTDINKIDFNFRKNWRSAFLNIHNEIWNTVNSRNTRVPFRQGFFEKDIWSFDEYSIREAVLNAFAHREYKNRTEPVFLKLSPEKFSIKSPGGFLPGVTPENILFVEGKWRNRLLMETLERIGLVERAGVGLDRIFKNNIMDGKGIPDFSDSDPDYVVLDIPSKVQDINFVEYLQKISAEKQITFDEIDDIIFMENIRTVGKSDNKEKINKFIKLNLIEKIGLGRGVRYILSKDYYGFIDKKEEYTRRKWIDRNIQKELLLQYFKDHKHGKMSDFLRLFEERLTRRQIQGLLKILKAEEFIYFDGKPRSADSFWKYKKN
ncbi:MAG: putative DNA binding domain-containing protein [Actinobacteria bacterium]|nr:putative DNA binding domain-containing protein [Actinomycetota bacterium]